MNDKLRTTTSEIHIGNDGRPAFYITIKNEAIIRKALKEFTGKMFDTPCVHYYVKIGETNCILDSIELDGLIIWAKLRHCVDDDIWRGVLFLGCEYEFDTKVDVDPQYLSFPEEDMRRNVYE